jgi:hypothetical protein
MIPLRMRMSRSARLYDGKFQPSLSEATPEFLFALEDMARTAGAADIRYVRVPRNAIFQDKGIPTSTRWSSRLKWMRPKSRRPPALSP